MKSLPSGNEAAKNKKARKYSSLHWGPYHLCGLAQSTDLWGMVKSQFQYEMIPIQVFG